MSLLADIAAHPYGADKGEGLTCVGREAAEKGPELAIEVARRLVRRLRMAIKVNQADDHDYFATHIAPAADRGEVELVEASSHADTCALLGDAAGVLFPSPGPSPLGSCPSRPTPAARPSWCSPTGPARTDPAGTRRAARSARRSGGVHRQHRTRARPPTGRLLPGLPRTLRRPPDGCRLPPALAAPALPGPLPDRPLVTAARTGPAGRAQAEDQRPWFDVDTEAWSRCDPVTATAAGHDDSTPASCRPDSGGR